MRLEIRYRTRFEYDRLVRESQNELRACPANDDHQLLISYRVTTVPTSRVLSFVDYFGTRVDAFGVREPHVLLDVHAEAAVETKPRPLLTVAPRRDALESAEFRDYYVEFAGKTRHTQWGRGIAAEAQRIAEFAGPDVVGLVLGVHRFVGTALEYAPGSTYVGVDVEEVLARRLGVCQDFAHLAVAMCRSLGIPARYVSGYLFTVDESERAGGVIRDPAALRDERDGRDGRDGDRRDGDGDGDAVDVQTHAWFEAAIPGFGWFGLDPTNQQQVGPRHVVIGHGRDYDDVQPLRGAYAGLAQSTIEVNVGIRRLSAAQAQQHASLTLQQAQQAQQAQQ